MKQFIRSLGRHAVIAMRQLVNMLPYPLYRVARSTLMIIAYIPMMAKRKTLFQNLRLAYGQEKTQDQLNDIAMRSLQNFGRGMIDLTYMVDHKELISSNFHYEGKAYLEKALAKGNGAILLSAHYGNFILMYLAMAQAGYKVNVIMKRARDKDMEEYISAFRKERNIQTIYDLPTRQCVVECIKALRRNELLFILLDQNYGGDGRVFVDFFGHPAATATGPVVFSQRTSAPILPIFIKHQEKDLHHTIQIYPEVQLVGGDDEAHAMHANIQNLTKIIEDKVRECPYEWGGWLHKRWKTRSKEEQSLIDQKIKTSVYN